MDNIQTNERMWVDAWHLQGVKPGSQGFLVGHKNTLTGNQRFELRPTPPKTNRSQEERPFGWCGTNNDVSTDGYGVWEVIKFSAGGQRVLLEEVTSVHKLSEFLDAYGYPDLLNEMLDKIEARKD